MPLFKLFEVSLFKHEVQHGGISKKKKRKGLVLWDKILKEMEGKLSNITYLTKSTFLQNSLCSHIFQTFF